MKNKLMSVLMTGTMVASTILPVCATEVTTGVTETQGVDQTEAEGGTDRECVVKYSQASTFTVTIPKTIVLDTATKTADYTVNVKGDISSDKQVKVAPHDMIEDTAGVVDFLMKDQATVSLKKADVTATVKQDVVIWTSEEVCIQDETPELVGTDKAGNVKAEDLTSGSWKGTFNFDIAMEDVVNN